MRERPMPGGDSKSEPYVEFTRRFFGRWVSAYDYFAASLAFAYRAAARELVPEPGRRILDLCTGTGEVGRRCAIRGARVTGVDLTPAMLVRAARKTRGLPFHPSLMDARELGFPADSFDAVCLSFALHDMPRKVRLQVLGEACRVARSNLVIVDYELPSRRWARRVVAWSIGLFETPYFRSFAQEGPQALFSDAGLQPATRRRLVPGLVSLYRFDVGGTLA